MKDALPIDMDVVIAGAILIDVGKLLEYEKVDGKAVETKKMARTLPIILQWDESFDIGSDTLTGVNDADYQPPFPLTAKLDKLTIKVDRPQLSPEDIKKLEAAMRNNKMSE